MAAFQRCSDWKRLTTVAKVIVKDIVSRFGVPLELHYEGGRSELQVTSVLGNILKSMNPEDKDQTSAVVSEHQWVWDQYLHSFLLAYHSSVPAPTEQMPGNVPFRQDIQLPCDLQFWCKPDDVASEDYIHYLKKQMEAIYDRVR